MNKNNVLWHWPRLSLFKPTLQANKLEGLSLATSNSLVQWVWVSSLPTDTIRYSTRVGFGLLANIRLRCLNFPNSKSRWEKCSSVKNKLECFPWSSFQELPNLFFEPWQEPTNVEHHVGPQKLVALPLNIRLGRKCFHWTRTLAYLCIKLVQKFYVQLSITFASKQGACLWVHPTLTVLLNPSF